jgi:hypothetical protein
MPFRLLLTCDLHPPIIAQAERGSPMNSRMLHKGLLIVTSVLALGLAAWGQCSNANVTGKYGFSGSGFLKNAQPISFAGFIKADGKGTYAGRETASVGGTIFKNVPLTGTYSINPDCTGSGTSKVMKAVNHFNLVVVSGGKSLQLVSADAGNVETETVQAQGTATCTVAGVNGTFGIQASGMFLTIGSVAFDGLFTLDGKGNVKGTESGSIAGSIFSGQPASGSYTVASNCTGTMAITVANQTEHSSFVVTNSGKGMLLVETDANTVVSGFGQQ